MLRGFIESSPNPDAASFQKFAARAMDTYPTVRALEWIPRIENKQRSAFEANLSKVAGSARCITQGRPGASLTCSANYPYYFPVAMIYPTVPENAVAFGFDILRNRATEPSATRAILTGEVAATGRVALLEKTSDRYGISTFLPVYSDNPAGKSPHWRDTHTRGLVMCIFQIGDVLRHGLEKLGEEQPGRQSLDFFFFDLTAKEENRYLYSRDQHGNSPSKTLPSSPAQLRAQRASTKLEQSTVFNVGGRQWEVVALSDHPAEGNDRYLGLLILLSGGLLTVGAILYLASHARLTGVLAKANDELRTEIEVREKAEKELEHLAYHDALTGLANRRLFALTFHEAIATSDGTLLGLVYLDLDGFKLINDTLGHTIGDTVLRIVSERLRQSVSTGDVIARTGGDEFNILLRGVKDYETAEILAAKVLETLEQPVEVMGHSLCVSASAGLSFYPDDGCTYENLCSAADAAMYCSKSRGKNQLQRFGSEVSTTGEQTRGIVLDLRSALERRQLCLYYQPLANMESRANIRFEALIRWEHPELGLLLPGQFLSIVEQTGLSSILGEWVLREAARNAMDWQSAAVETGVGVSVNISATHFSRPDFIAMVRRVLLETGLNPSLLEIEITESSVLTNFDDARRKLEALRLLGISVALDDFGTGYSGLSYLPNLPLDALKIDKSFVVDLERHSAAASLLESLISLAKKQKMRVIVEGVETPRQMALIRAMKADELQGYLLGRPMPQSAVLRFLQTWFSGDPATYSETSPSTSQSTPDPALEFDLVQL